ncbi:hypothetical protein GCM10010841_32080 [Deinococcus aerophilus]|uniref:PKD domain-containing protein n=2 Tax=Deinococcus aerophilus TaxID=522488 RepID=A0ABQ2H0Z3_9DEIO|nr:hypothetical protein GCM10010841_32080 [Deinococcus aerophilus]
MITQLGPDYVTAFETGVARDLVALGLNGDLSGQGIAPKSYLNVLKINDSSARIYVKSTYPVDTGCTVDWGDGSSTAVVTPTPASVGLEKQDHTYSQSGSYTIILTCGRDVKKMIFKATAAMNSLGLFDDYVGNFYKHGGGEEGGAPNPFITKGFTFKSSSNYVERNGWGLPPNHIGLVLSCGPENSFATENGSTFTLNSISAGTIWGDFIQITGYDGANQIIGTATFTNNGTNLEPIETRTLNWKNVSRVVCSGGSYFHVDDMDASIDGFLAKPITIN